MHRDPQYTGWLGCANDGRWIGYAVDAQSFKYSTSKREAWSEDRYSNWAHALINDVVPCSRLFLKMRCGEWAMPLLKEPSCT